MSVSQQRDTFELLRVVGRVTPISSPTSSMTHSSPDITKTKAVADVSVVGLGVSTRTELVGCVSWRSLYA